MIVYDVPLCWRRYVPPGRSLCLTRGQADYERQLATYQSTGTVGDIVYAHPSRIHRWLSLPHHVTLRTWPDDVEITKREGVMPVNPPYMPNESVGIGEGLWDTILSQEVISLDTETDSTGTPNPHRDKLVGLSIGWKDGEIYVPAESIPVDFSDRLSSHVNRGSRLVGHNSKFDTLVLRRAGHSIRFTDDTMLMAYLHGGLLPLGLKPLTRELLGREATELGPLIKRFGRVGAIPREMLEPYAKADARNTWDVYEKLSDKVDVLYHVLEMPMMHLLTDMEKIGWRVDKSALSVLQLKMLQEQGRVEEALAFVGVESPTKNQQIAELLIQTGATLPKTPTGKWCTDEDTLEAIDHPLSEPWLTWRYYHKRLSTWIRALGNTDEGSYIHPSYRQAPRSGRLSCANPNAQNFPPEPRSCLVADPDCYLIAADCSQFELRIMARQSGDPVLIEEFIQGADIHQRNLEELMLPDRLTAKKTMYGVSYGLDAKRLSEETGNNIDVCKRFIGSLFSKYKVLARHINKVRNSIRQLGYSKTALGRIRYFPEAALADSEVSGHALRAGWNHTIQGTAADLMKMGQIFLTPLLADHGARVVAQIHDEFVISTPEPFKSYDALMQMVDHIQPWLDPVPFVLDVKLGRNWKETK